MHSLELLQAFAVGWHARGSDLNALYDELGAELIVRPGGRKVLGFVVALEGIRQVVLSERLTGTSLRNPVLAHECAHLLIGVQGVSLCARTPRPGSAERDAWAGAALLAVPDGAIPTGPTERRELANALNVPVALLDLRAALNAYLGGPTPCPLDAYRDLGGALRGWYACFDRESRRL
jgi:hypothetical protein